MCLAALASVDPGSMYRPELWWVSFRALDAAGDSAAADEALRQGVAWIETTARAHVPAEFQDSFRHRNAINRAMLTSASGRLGGSLA